MKNLTIEELEEKYGNIEDKVPSIFKDYNDVSINMQQDLYCTWGITNNELYRVISLVGMKTNDDILYKHLDSKHSYFGLYPNKIQQYDISPYEYSKQKADDIDDKKRL